MFSLTHLGTLWVDEIAGIALGAIALSRIRQARQTPADSDPPPRTEGAALAWGGIIVGIISLGVAFVIYFVLPPHR